MAINPWTNTDVNRTWKKCVWYKFENRKWGVRVRLNRNTQISMDLYMCIKFLGILSVYILPCQRNMLNQEKYQMWVGQRLPWFPLGCSWIQGWFFTEVIERKHLQLFLLGNGIMEGFFLVFFCTNFIMKYKATTYSINKPTQSTRSGMRWRGTGWCRRNRLSVRPSWWHMDSCLHPRCLRASLYKGFAGHLPSQNRRLSAGE